MQVPVWFTRHASVLWMLQLAPIAVLQQLALHACAGDLCMVEDVSTLAPQYLSHPVISMGVMSGVLLSVHLHAIYFNSTVS